MLTGRRVEENKRTRDGEEIVVRVLKFDGRERRRWPARVARHDGPLIVLDAVFDEEILHDLLGTIGAGTISREYYWLDRWYNVFRFFEPTGEFRNLYCNINMPPTLSESVLDYVDLDIDILVWPDENIIILDESDFEENAVKFKYPTELREQARRAFDELQRLLRERSRGVDIASFVP